MTHDVEAVAKWHELRASLEWNGASVKLHTEAAATIWAAMGEIERLRAVIANPPKHEYWGAGEPDCPRDLKAGNGELHTLRCKVCGLDSPRDDICRAQVQP